jgi:hypothetical protein
VTVLQLRAEETRLRATLERELFLSPRKDYSPLDAARLTDNDPAELERLIAKGHLEARTLYLIEKPDVLRLALDRWPLETIFGALGTDAEDLLPPLLRLERMDLKVRPAT